MLSVTAVAFTVATLAYNAFSAILDFVRLPRILDQMAKAGVPHSWWPWLGVVKLAGVIGSLVGFAVPGARDYEFGLQYPFLAVALATLGLRIAVA